MDNKIHPATIAEASTGLEDNAAFMPFSKETTGTTQSALSLISRQSSAVSEKVQVYMKAPRIVLKNHTRSVYTLGVVQDMGKGDTLILSGGEDKIVDVWSLLTGELLANLSGHVQRVSGVVGFTGSGMDRLAVSCSWDESCRIWNLEPCYNPLLPVEARSRMIMESSVKLGGFKNRVLCIATLHTPNAQPIVAAGSSDNTIRVYSLPRGEFLFKLGNAEDVTWNLCMASWTITSSDYPAMAGPVLITGCRNNTVRVWKLQLSAGAEGLMVPASPFQALPALVIRGHNSAVHSLSAFECNDEPLVVTVCKDFDIRVWSLLTGELMKTLKGHKNSISSIAANDISTARGGAIIVSSSKVGNMRIWKYSTGELMRVFNGHTDEITTVSCFATPDPTKDDLIILSGSKDCTARTWLFAEEESLRVLTHGEKIRVNCVDVYDKDADPLIITGADDGFLRAWRVRRIEGSVEVLEWQVLAHKSRILGLMIYVPHRTALPWADEAARKARPTYLDQPLVVSGSQDGMVRLCSLETGIEVCAWQAHSAVLTSVCLHAGAGGTYLGRHYEGTRPFLMTGSEDNTARVWDLYDNRLKYTLEGHIFDVTAVWVFQPEPEHHHTRKEHAHSLSRATSQKCTPRGPNGPPETLQPVLITASMDNTVCLWSHSDGSLVEMLEDSDTHITSLSAMNVKEHGPIIAGGDGAGNVRIWSLRPPYMLLFTLKGHTDEVTSVQLMHPEGVYPVLVSGSLDQTMRLWDMSLVKHKSTIEGHSDDITCLKVFGGSDACVASGSIDTTVRVLFDFMGTIPNVDVVEQMFTFDKDGKNSHLLDSDSKTLWPRISKMARQEGPEQFFGQYYSLFGKALRRGRADFLQEFLPTTAIGLLKSNNEWEDGTGGDGRGSLMQQAVDMGDTIAVRTIVDCWCAYLTKDPSSDTDLLYDPILGRVSMPDMLLLASSYPKEFQQLVCSVKLQPAAFNKMPVGAIFMYSDPDIVLEHYCAETLSVQPHLSVSQKPKRREKAYDVVSEEGDEDDAAGLKVSEKHLSDPVHKINRHQTYLFLPVQNAVHMDMMRAYTATCEVLDSVAIFDSEMGQLALSYAWRTIGIRAHVKALSLYGIFVMIATAGTLSFKELHTDPKLWLVSLLLIVSQLLFDAYFVNKEKEQFIVAPLEYLSDVWNLIDFNVIVSNVSGNLLRLCFWQEGYASRILLSWCSVFMFFNALYFLRAFESTGPLVSMIMQICSDIRHLLLVLLLVLLGFAQAFWLVANTRDDLAFSTIQDSLINSFSFMLGNYDPEAFVGADLESFGNILTAFYMVTMAILLLNLLIALMGDSYGAVKEKGLAQWKYEQAMIITEMQGSMEESDTRREDTIYFRKNTEDLTTEVEVQEDVRMENVESAVKAMQHQQGVLMKQQEALLKLVGDQSAMLEQLLGAKPA